MVIGIPIDDYKIEYWKKVGKILDGIFERRAKKLGCSKYSLSLTIKPDNKTEWNKGNRSLVKTAVKMAEFARDQIYADAAKLLDNHFGNEE